MSSRQPAYHTRYPLSGPPQEPIPPLPPRSHSDPVKTKPLPLHSSTFSASVSDLSIPRVPPTDPRRARRRCADFGFRRELHCSPLTVLNSPSVALADEDNISSPGLTSSGTFTSTESDETSLSDLPYDFPQPPPIILRRMKSSPLFVSEHAPTADIKRWGAIPALDHLADLQTELEFAPPFESMSESYRGRLDGLTRELEPIIQPSVRDAPVFLPRTFDQDTIDLREKFVMPTSYKSASSNRCLPSESERTSITTTPADIAPPPHPPLRCIAKMRSLKFAPDSSSSMERMQITFQNPSAASSKSLFRGRSISMDFQKSHSLFVSTPKKPRPTYVDRVPGQRASTDPLARNHPSLVPAANHGRSLSLSTPFLHRPTNAPRTRTRDSCLHQSMNVPSPGLRSFIDITPEQARRKSSLMSGEKMKKLFSRASQIFDWKKKKTSTSQ